MKNGEITKTDHRSKVQKEIPKNRTGNTKENKSNRIERSGKAEVEKDRKKERK